MVTFKLIEENDSQLIYWYYPDGDETLKPGVITVDRDTWEIKIEELAEKDFYQVITVSEINATIDEINKMKEQIGDTNLIDYVSEPEHIAFYGSHAINELAKSVCTGVYPEKGSQIWT